MAALMSRLSLSVGRENGPELGLKIVSLTLKWIKATTALMGRLSLSVSSENNHELGL